MDTRLLTVQFAVNDGKFKSGAIARSETPYYLAVFLYGNNESVTITKYVAPKEEDAKEPEVR